MLLSFNQILVPHSARVESEVRPRRRTNSRRSVAARLLEPGKFAGR